ASCSQRRAFLDNCYSSLKRRRLDVPLNLLAQMPAEDPEMSDAIPFELRKLVEKDWPSQQRNQRLRYFSRNISKSRSSSSSENYRVHARTMLLAARRTASSEVFFARQPSS